MKVLEENSKQFLVFSNAGKPILCLGGNEEDLSSLMATARALMSVSAQKCCEKLKYVR